LSVVAAPALSALVERVRDANASRRPLRLRGGGSKDFYGEPPRGDQLDLRGLDGAAEHEPTELVVTAPAGMSVAALEAQLGRAGPVPRLRAAALRPELDRRRHGRRRPLGPGAGPRRIAARPPARRLAPSGSGELMHFGGKVIKNVAGLRRLARHRGSLGTLGIVVQASLKVLPRAEAEATLRFDMKPAEALAALHAWGGEPLPLDASAWWNGNLVLRLRGAAARSMRQAAPRRRADSGRRRGPFWQGLRDHRDEFFLAASEAIEHQDGALWRLSLPPTAPLLGLAGDELIEWHGGQRWLVTALPAALIREAAASVGGHATLFRGRDKSAGVFTPLEPALPGDPRAAEARLRSERHPQSRPPLSRPLRRSPPSHADRPHPRVRRHARWHRGRRHPEKVRALRLLHRDLPTYQLLGDELDGPRGRIYLIKQVLEGHAPTRSTQLHLDRCLTCRNCETTCPSGVQYGNLVEIGRRIVDERVPRPPGERDAALGAQERLTSPLFKPALKVGQLVRSVLPEMLKAKVPAAAPAAAHRWPRREHPRKVLLLLGCVQPAMAPNINSATARVLDAAGIQTLVAEDAGCCGAIHLHGGDPEGGLERMRRNIDAWWPLVSSGGVEAIVMNASGCGVTVKEYGHALRLDPAYADKANRIADLTRDLSELLPDIVPALAKKLTAKTRRPRLAFHPPCTLQHGQKLRGGVETHLRALGFAVDVALNEAHLCCGSAGTYSVLHPSWRCRCATASSGISPRSTRNHRLGQHRLHPAPAERHSACRPPLGGGGG
jgi:glycolate oxidase iron-sulfur subunit